MIPQYSIMLPVRSRTSFTTNALPTLILNGVRKDHQIILVLDRTSLIYEAQRYPAKYPPHLLEQILEEDKEGIDIVDNWIKTHSDILKKYDIVLVTSKGGEGLWLDNRRISSALEEGRWQIKHDWVIGFADEDFVFQKNWDEILWSHMVNKDPMKFCVMPTIAAPAYMNPEPDVSFTWLENYCKDNWLVLHIPVSDQKILGHDYRFPYSKYENFIQKVSLPGQSWIETCGCRIKGNSTPFFINNSLLNSVCGWSMEGLYSEHHSLDARLDYRLANKGVIKIIPRDCIVLHTKHFLFINDDIDQTWGAMTNFSACANVTPGLL